MNEETEQTQIPLPTIHMNGTSGKSMYAEYRNAMDAVQDAMESLNDATLNGRDYYPQGPEAFEKAREHRNAMNQKLRSVLSDLGHIALSIHDQARM